MTRKIISDRIAERLKKASEHASEFKTTYHKTVPLVGQGVEDANEFRQKLEKDARQAKEVYDNLKKMSQEASGLYQNLAVIYGYMQEGEQIAEEQWNNLAQVTTLALNFDIFLQSDPKLMIHILQTVDVPVLEEAMEKIDPIRLISIQKAIQRTIEKHREK